MRRVNLAASGSRAPSGAFGALGALGDLAAIRAFAAFRAFGAFGGVAAAAASAFFLGLQLVHGAVPAAAAAPPASAPAAAPAVAPAPAPSLLEERWYELSIGGQPCGWYSERVERAGDRVRTNTETQMRIGRLGQSVVLSTRTTFEETARGEPVKVTVVKESGTAPIKSSWLFGPGGIDVIEEQGGRTAARRYPLPPEGCLTPRGVDEFVRRRLAADARELAYTSLDPESGPTPVRVESRRTGAAQAVVNGRTVSVSEWTTKSTLVERPSTELLSADGVLVRSSTDIGVGVLESRLTTREAATAAKGSVELMAKTFVPVAGDARALTGARSAELRISSRAGTLGDLPSAGAQRCTRVAPGVLDIAVDAGGGSEATPGELQDPRYRRASVMVDCDDPKVRALATAALKGAGEAPLARAEALRSAVARHISKKDLASGFGSASEAATSRAGDCTEHAVLLAAMLRAAGIPSRVVTGLVYVQQVGAARNSYGWHMWTQGIIDGRWMDFDAVMPAGPRRFDASRLMTGSSAADGPGLDSDLVRIVDLMGAIVIEVKSIDGRLLAPQQPAPR